MAIILEIHLPTFNGNFQVGLAANADLSLPDTERLVFVNAKTAHESGVLSAAATLASMPPQMDTNGQVIIANAAYCLWPDREDRGKQR
jgi:hypothetical protein